MMVLLLEVGSHQGESAKYMRIVLSCSGPKWLMKGGLLQTVSSRRGSFAVEAILTVVQDQLACAVRSLKTDGGEKLEKCQRFEVGKLEVGGRKAWKVGSERSRVSEVGRSALALVKGVESCRAWWGSVAAAGSQKAGVSLH